MSASIYERGEAAGFDETSTEVEVQSEDEESATSNVPDQPSRERLLEAVSNRRRRYLIHYLQRRSAGPVDLADASRQVAAWERGTELDSISYTDRKNVHTSLYQFHAPKLAEIGLIKYDKRGSTVELTPYGENLRLQLDATPAERRLSRVVVVPVGLAIAAVFASTLDVPYLQAIPDTAWTLFVSVLFVGSILVQIWRNRQPDAIVTQHPPEPIVDE